jgi:hypothetical protein
MEVHRHSHTPGKKFTNYLWEFLMLFLAVFCGFLAENFREHQIEHRREKQFAKELYSELLDDSTVAGNKVKLRLGKEADMNWLSAYFKDSSLTSLCAEFYPAYTTVMFAFNSYSFEPKDGILNQLRNSGSLRYFKSVALQKLFGDISVCINNVRTRNEQEYQFFANPVKPFLLKYYDFDWANQLRNRNENISFLDLINQYRLGNDLIPGTILNVASLDRKETSNMIMFYKQMLVSTRTLQYNNYIVTNHKLLEELRKDYKLE